MWWWCGGWWWPWVERGGVANPCGNGRIAAFGIVGRLACRSTAEPTCDRLQLSRESREDCHRLVRLCLRVSGFMAQRLITSAMLTF